MSKSKINFDSFKYVSISYKILVGFCCVSVSVFSVYLFANAGIIDSPAVPSNDLGRMYTLEQIYQKFYNGTVAAHSTGFTEPSSAPGSTMHTLDNIYNDFTADAASSGGTTAADVRSGKTFFDTSGTTRGTNWGPVVGTMQPDTPLATGQISNYGVSQTCADGNVGTCEDSYYKEGLSISKINSYSNVVVNGQYVAETDSNDGLMWQKCAAGLSDANEANTCAVGTPITLEWMNAGATDAINYCENLALCSDGTFVGNATTPGVCSSPTTAVYTDWRLPNIKELFSLTLDELLAVTDGGTTIKSSVPPFINQYAFPDGINNGYWSSTTYPSKASYAFDVSFSTAAAAGSGKSSAYYIRCVRGQ